MTKNISTKTPKARTKAEEEEVKTASKTRKTKNGSLELKENQPKTSTNNVESLETKKTPSKKKSKTEASEVKEIPQNIQSILNKKKEERMSEMELSENKVIYPCYLEFLANSIEMNGRNYLSTHRKMLSMKNEDFDMTSIYIVSYKFEEHDEDNYLYTFFLDKLELTFDMDKYRKFFYMKLKKLEEVKSFLQDNTLESFTQKLTEEGIGHKFFLSEIEFELMRTEAFKYIKTYTALDNFNIATYILYMTISSLLEPVRFHTGEFAEKVPLLKKKSTEKIHNTFSNRLFHLAVYGEDSELFSEKKISF